jgi:predicted MFS family arabinose efflux permease
MGTGHAIAPITGGMIIESYSMNLLWITTALAALIGATGVFLIYLREKQEQK